MSVGLFPAVPEAPESAFFDPAAPRLHLVPVHEHAWRLRTVEYDDGLEVCCYECADCDDVLFR